MLCSTYQQKWVFVVSALPLYILILSSAVDVGHPVQDRFILESIHGVFCECRCDSQVSTFTVDALFFSHIALASVASVIELALVNRVVEQWRRID